VIASPQLVMSAKGNALLRAWCNSGDLVTLSRNLFEEVSQRLCTASRHRLSRTCARSLAILHDRVLTLGPYHTDWLPRIRFLAAHILLSTEVVLRVKARRRVVEFNGVPGLVVKRLKKCQSSARTVPLALGSASSAGSRSPSRNSQVGCKGGDVK
jgi:hypothetical protein